MNEVASTAPPRVSVGTELSMRRTGMAFQRTRMAADRTLMAVIRTSLSLIAFGFTIFQFFRELRHSGVLEGSAPARNFGISLVLLGTVMLILGIVYHVLFMLGLRRAREAMKSEGALHAESQFPPSLVLIVAVLLLLIGLTAAGSMLLHVKPYD